MNPKIQSLFVALLSLGNPACSDGDAAMAGSCPPASSIGTELGETLPDVTVLRCDGSEVSLHSLLCSAEVTLLDIGSAAYPACVEATREYSSDAEFDSLQDAGLQIIQIFTSDTNLLPATPEFCERYTEFHGVDFEFLVDPHGATEAFAEVSPLHFVVNGSGEVVEKWNPVIPPDRIARLWGFLGVDQ